MFLKDLFRYRTRQSRESREDFLSACLAELMRRDEPACRAALKGVGLSAPSGLANRRIRTQVGRRSPKGSMRWCDIMVEAGSRRLIIECKEGANPPDHLQCHSYAELWDAEVALLCPAATLPSLDDPLWDGVQRGSWQGLWEELEIVKDEGDPTFRLALLDLMDDLKLGGCPDRSPAQIRATRSAWKRLEGCRLPMRKAVLDLLPRGTLALQANSEEEEDASPTQPEWYEADPLEAYWGRTALRDGTGLLGLSLEARPLAGVGHADLEWRLGVLPASRLRAPLARANREHRDLWELDSSGWWERVLGDTGGPNALFRSQLRSAIAEARLCLTDLGVTAGGHQFRLLAPTVPASEIAATAAHAGTLSDPMGRWGLRLGAMIQSRSQAALGAAPLARHPLMRPS